MAHVSEVRRRRREGKRQSHRQRDLQCEENRKQQDRSSRRCTVNKKHHRQKSDDGEQILYEVEEHGRQREYGTRKPHRFYQTARLQERARRRQSGVGEKRPRQYTEQDEKRKAGLADAKDVIK